MLEMHKNITIKLFECYLAHQKNLLRMFGNCMFDERENI